MVISCLLCLVLQYLLSLIVSVHSYQPIEDFVIICGTSTPLNNPNAHRTRIGNIQSQRFSLIESRKDNPSQTTSPSPQHLYGSARLSHSEFTYSFSLTDGPKFLRLHFYPDSYLNFRPYDSLFSVKSGNFTLLKDFNPSLVADYKEGLTVSREYCIHVDPGQRLNVTFTPSLTHTNAYAFINAIEVVSMPNYLYFTDPNKEGLPLVGHNYHDFGIGNSTAMEMAYRINVGGKALAPEGDPGMFRIWETDDAFLEKVRPASLPYDITDKLDYGNFPNYTAPEKVYRAGRSYGMNQTSRYNVTWEFDVVSEFDYFVRLHFCELDPDVHKAGERLFQIFIAESMAEERADAIMWSGGRMVPCYRDYAVRFDNRSLERRLNLSIKLQPHPNAGVYRDVILNGIEIFKLSNENTGNLAEPNPQPYGSPSSKATTIVIAVGVASGFTVLSILGFIIFRRRFRAPKQKDGDSRWGQKPIGMSKSSKSRGSSLPSDLCRCFSIAEIKEATKNFDDIFIVGVGGFGNVYKGYIDNGTVPVAIKRLKPGSQQGAHEFQTEIEMLSQLRHLHLVSLIGYCSDGDEMILVYEFMAHGTLRDHLYSSDNNPLSWKQRLEMCLGAARGLHYLHTGAKHNIIHRDVKTTNILIDEKWIAKVSDFGISRIGPTGMSRSHISTVVKGSVGYLDPEYYKRQRLTEKSDVYSFGVVLLEVLCGRPPLLRTVEKQKASLVEWVRKCHREGVIHEMVDPLLIGRITPECLKAFSEMALKCLMDDGNERPSMSEVVWGLEFALELQESTEGEALGGATDEERALLNKGRNEEENEVGLTSSEGVGSESKSRKMTISSSEEEALVSGMVFSELRNPTER